MALKNASDGQRESFGRLSELFVPREIRFTLIGAAALREHGLIRLTDDLDIVVDPYAKAVPILAASSEFVVLPESEDWTSRTCTQRHVKTGVMIDFLTGGIRINYHTHFPLGIVHDPIPIPEASGYGNVADLKTLIAMKVCVVITGDDMHRYGATTGVRSLPKLMRDVEDVRTMISVCRLERGFSLGDERIQRKYEEIFDTCRR